MNAVRTMNGANAMVKVMLTKVSSGGIPSIENSGRRFALIARIVAAVTTMAGSETASSVRESSEIS